MGIFLYFPNTGSRDPSRAIASMFIFNTTNRYIPLETMLAIGYVEVVAQLAHIVKHTHYEFVLEGGLVLFVQYSVWRSDIFFAQLCTVHIQYILHITYMFQMYTKNVQDNQKVIGYFGGRRNLYLIMVTMYMGHIYLGNNGNRCVCLWVCVCTLMAFKLILFVYKNILYLQNIIMGRARRCS